MARVRRMLLWSHGKEVNARWLAVGEPMLVTRQARPGGIVALGAWHCRVALSEWRGRVAWARGVGAWR